MKRNLLFISIAVVVVGAVAAFVLSRDDPRVEGLAPVGRSPLGAGGVIGGGSFEAEFSPDGSRLAVIGPDGLGLAVEGRVRPITARGSKVVDFAWFGAGTTLLVAEGPEPTGGLAVVDIDGKVRGTIPLNPSVGFGSGHGMTIEPGGKRAVVTAVAREPVGGLETRTLTLVDLTTGQTTPLFEGERPFFLDDGRLLYTIEGERPSVAISELAAGASTEIVETTSRSAGVVAGGYAAYTSPGSVSVINLEDPSGRSVLGKLPGGTSIVALHPSGRQAVVVGGGSMRAVELDGPPE